MSEVIVRRSGEEPGKGLTYTLRPSELKAVAEDLWPGPTVLQVHETRNQEFSQEQRTQMRLAHRWHLLKWEFNPGAQHVDPRLRPLEERVLHVRQFGIGRELLSLPVARRSALVSEIRNALRLHVPKDPWPEWSLRVDLDEGQRLLDWTFQADGRKETWTSLV